MKVYLLYYDNDYGCREDWNTFHTPVEVFLSEKERQDRIDFIKANSEDYTDDDCFYEVDTDVMTPEQAKEWSND